MIQLTRSTVNTTEYIYLDIYDKMTNTDYRPLFTFTSQESGYSFTSISFNADYANKDRYVKCGFIIGSTFNASLGFITFGNTNSPYGFYDVTVYQNTDNSNLDPTGLTVLFSGLANLSAVQTGLNSNPAIKYTEYNTNDTDTQSVYVTI